MSRHHTPAAPRSAPRTFTFVGDWVASIDGEPFVATVTAPDEATAEAMLAEELSTYGYCYPAAEIFGDDDPKAIIYAVIEGSPPLTTADAERRRIILPPPGNRPSTLPDTGVASPAPGPADRRSPEGTGTGEPRGQEDRAAAGPGASQHGPARPCGIEEPAPGSRGRYRDDADACGLVATVLEVLDAAGMELAEHHRRHAIYDPGMHGVFALSVDDAVVVRYFDHGRKDEAGIRSAKKRERIRAQRNAALQEVQRLLQEAGLVACISVGVRASTLRVDEVWVRRIETRR